MTGRHPTDLELARFDESESRPDLAHHLRWCSSCRRILADYDWLEREMVPALRAEADTARLAGPDWDALRKRLDRREATMQQERRLLAAGVALMAGVMLLAPSALGSSVRAQAAQDDPLSAPPPPGIAASAASGVAKTHSAAVRRVDRQPGVSLPFVPPPTPPELER